MTLAPARRSGKIRVRPLLFGFIAAISLSTTALAAEATGEWLVAERTARIRIVDCAGALWGIVSWESDPGTDAKNPDPAKRTRPILGIPILLAMKSSGPNRWTGSIYNSENGKIYSGGISLVDSNMLRIRGCILGFLCGGENWTRADSSLGEFARLSDAAICSRPDLAP
jgi:uncharacterized protein (DUF2147 family)